MLVLALDTATTDLVAGLVKDGEEVAVATIPTRAHNELLVPEVQKLLAQAGTTFADVDEVVAGCGPGPFTGLRVGMATASALAQALRVPLRGVCTHDAVATQLKGSALVVTDARRREVYWARYEDGVRLEGPDVCKPTDLTVEAVDVLSVPPNLAEQIQVSAGQVGYFPPTPAGLAAAPEVEFAPLYLRRPDAVEPKQAPKSPALP